MKYILKKEYPGSPKLGNTIDNLENDWIENYPEYWEELVEKDYEILSLIEGKFIYPCDKYSKDFINQLFNTLGINIYSVKRLSDGEIFTIGDKVNNSEFGGNGILKGIRNILNSDYLAFNIEYIKDLELWEDSDDSEASLKYLSKVKQPLFTTEQVKEIENIIKNYIK